MDAYVIALFKLQLLRPAPSLSMQERSHGGGGGGGGGGGVGLLRVSEYSDTRGSEYKIEYEYSSLPKSLDRDLFFFFFFFTLF